MAENGNPIRYTPEKIIEISKQTIAPTTQNFSFVPGITPLGTPPCWIMGEDGNLYFDANSGPGVFSIGHRRLEIERVKADVRFGFGANEYPNYESVKLAERLIALSPGGFDKKIFFCSSGTESVEAAIRAAQIYRRTPIMMAFEKAFHGRTYGARTLTSRKHVTKFSYPAFPVIHLPFPEAETEMGNPLTFMKHVKRQLATVNLNEVAALFWEPVQGEGGIRFTSRDAFEALMEEIIVPNNILLVDDEVQTFSRTGKWFAAEHFGVNPDIICMAKALGSGAKIGVTIMRADVCWPEGGLYSNTWGGDAFSSACALKTLDIMEEENLISKAERLGDLFLKELAEAISETGGEKSFKQKLVYFHGKLIGIVSKGMGLMRKIEFIGREDDGPATEFRQLFIEETLNRRILLMPCGDSAVRVMPPLVVSENEIKWLAKELVNSIVSALERFKD